MLVFLIMPSRVLARGVEGVFHDLGEFKVEGIVSDISSREEAILKNMSVDVIIVDPSIFPHSAQTSARHLISEYTDAAVVAFPSIFLDEECVRTSSVMPYLPLKTLFPPKAATLLPVRKTSLSVLPKV